MNRYQAVAVDTDVNIMQRASACRQSRERAIAQAKSLYGENAAIVRERGNGFMSHDVVWIAGEQEAA